jgi:FdrA protein
VAAEAGTAGAPPPPRTVAAALRGGGTLALISVPGQHAFVEAMDAVRGGASVMLFSDNVPVEQEILLKDEAARRGVLVMGPDCGTAAVGGLGLGFANALRPGPVGMVAASGTGAQQVSCLLDAAGIGVTAILGVGGRDLSAAVAGRSTLAAMELLDAHQGTELVIVLSKPPDPAVADRLRARAAELRTPALIAFLGRGQPDLTAVTQDALSAVGAAPVQPAEWPAPYRRAPRKGFLRGLFSGGTLCDEAMIIAAERLGPIASNIPLEPGWALGDDLRSPGHLMVDFGDDRLTVGRPHPMIDHSLRIERILTEAADPACAVLLLDVVLGYGAHPDPGHSLAPAIARARERASADGRDLAVVVSLTGSRDDPQGRDTTAGALAATGASVHLSNAAAARTAVALIAGAGQ